MTKNEQRLFGILLVVVAVSAVGIAAFIISGELATLESKRKAFRTEINALSTVELKLPELKARAEALRSIAGPDRATNPEKGPYELASSLAVSVREHGLSLIHSSISGKAKAESIEFTIRGDIAAILEVLRTLRDEQNYFISSLSLAMDVDGKSAESTMRISHED